jgi:hypothetical protein
MNSPLHNRDKKSYQYEPSNIFAGTAPTIAQTQCFILLFSGILKTAVLSAPVENEDTLSEHISDALQATCNSTGTF